MLTCYQCENRIESNDDAGICVECGGRNIRIVTPGKITDTAWYVLTRGLAICLTGVLILTVYKELI